MYNGFISDTAINRREYRTWGNWGVRVKINVYELLLPKDLEKSDPV